MANMNVMRFNDSSAEPRLIAGIAPILRPGPGELLVQVHAASARNAEFLSQLGAEQVIDYQSGRFEEQVSGADVVCDGVGGTTLKRSWNVLKPAGRMVTIAADSEGEQDERTKAAFFIVEPNRQELSEIARLLDCGDLTTCVDGIVPLAQGSAAYLGTTGRQLGRGKVVIVLINQPTV
jgi:NADPH:quinone reductase-like Zn-dependent oxidoreductase